MYYVLPYPKHKGQKLYIGYNRRAASNGVNCCMSIPLFVGEAHSTRFNNFAEGVNLLEKAMAGFTPLDNPGSRVMIGNSI